MFLICWYLQNTIGCHTSKHWIRCEPGRCPHLLFILDLTAIVEPPLEIELLAQYDTIMYGWVVRLVSCTSLLFLSFFLSFVPVSLSLSLYISLPVMCPCISLATTLSLSIPVMYPCISLSTSLSLSFVPVSFSIQLSPFLSLSLVPVSLSLHLSPCQFIPVSLSLQHSPCHLSLYLSPYTSLHFSPCHFSLISLSLSLYMSLTCSFSHLFLFLPRYTSLSLLLLSVIRNRIDPAHRMSLVPLLRYTTQAAETGSLVYSFPSHLSGSGRSHLIKY